ncbi:ty3-gypsy retrotransposon protein [Tanacetum coccineum]
MPVCISKQYASLAAPLTHLLRKDAFIWTNAATVAFNNSKVALTNTPVLALPDFSKPFLIQTDASRSGVGAVLSQDGHLIAYFSKQMSPRLQQASTYVREIHLSSINGLQSYLDTTSQSLIAWENKMDLLMPCLVSHMYLPWAEWCYNTLWHSSIKMTPFEAVYGRPPPSLKDYVAGTSKLDAVDDLLHNRTELISQLQANIQRAQLRMRNQTNARRSDVHSQVDDWVFVKLQPYHQSSVALHQSHKLSKRFFGPFRIVEHIGQLLIHDKLVPQVLIRWQDQTPSEATWEYLDALCKDFPTFHLEDKVLSEAKGNDANPLPNETDLSKVVERRSTRMTRKPTKLNEFV